MQPGLQLAADALGTACKCLRQLGVPRSEPVDWRSLFWTLANSQKLATACSAVADSQFAPAGKSVLQLSYWRGLHPEVHPYRYFQPGAVVLLPKKLKTNGCFVRHFQLLTPGIAQAVWMALQGFRN